MITYIFQREPFKMFSCHGAEWDYKKMNNKKKRWDIPYTMPVWKDGSSSLFNGGYHETRKYVKL